MSAEARIAELGLELPTPPSPGGTYMPVVQVGEDGSAPAFTLTDTSGRSVSLSEFRGQKVVLNFWEEWCGPCKAEIPGLNSFARKHPDVVVLGLASDSGGIEELVVEKERLKIQFRVVKSDASVRRSYGVKKVPTTFLIDEQGKVAHSQVGVVTPIKLGAWLR